MSCVLSIIEDGQFQNSKFFNAELFDSVLNNTTMKGGVNLDKATIEDFANALAEDMAKVVHNIFANEEIAKATFKDLVINGSLDFDGKLTVSDHVVEQLLKYIEEGVGDVATDKFLEQIKERHAYLMDKGTISGATTIDGEASKSIYCALKDQIAEDTSKAAEEIAKGVISDKLQEELTLTLTGTTFKNGATFDEATVASVFSAIEASLAAWVKKHLLAKPEIAGAKITGAVLEDNITISEEVAATVFDSVKEAVELSISKAIEGIRVIDGLTITNANLLGGAQIDAETADSIFNTIKKQVEEVSGESATAKLNEKLLSELTISLRNSNIFGDVGLDAESSLAIFDQIKEHITPVIDAAVEVSFKDYDQKTKEAIAEAMKAKFEADLGAIQATGATFKVPTLENATIKGGFTLDADAHQTFADTVVAVIADNFNTMVTDALYKQLDCLVRELFGGKLVFAFSQSREVPVEADTKKTKDTTAYTKEVVDLVFYPILEETPTLEQYKAGTLPDYAVVVTLDLGANSYTKQEMDDKIAVINESIDDVSDAVEGLQKDVETNKKDIETNKGDIEDLQEDVATNKGDIEELQKDVGTNKDDIKDLQAEIIDLKKALDFMRECTGCFPPEKDTLIYKNTNGEIVRVPLGTGSKVTVTDAVEVISWGYSDREVLGVLVGSEHLLKVPSDSPKWTKDFSQMFRGAKLFNQDISGWDVSHVEDMSGMFWDASNFNQPIGNWDTSNVKDMSDMFFRATKFNQPIGNWDTSNVIKMNSTFQYASNFDQDINGWITSQVKGMNSMFYWARKFNQSLNDWDVSNVDNMRAMFEGAEAFNQPLDKWDVRKVKNMNHMFAQALAFDQDISSWCVESITEEPDYFAGDLPEDKKPVWGTCPKG